MTFSIVARDSKTGDLGIAVQSKFPAVGSIVPWLDIRSGAIATQALANLEYGRMGLKLLNAGLSAEKTLQVLIDTDKESSTRQVGIVDLQGNAVTFTGSDCYPSANGVTGDGVACQGNILASDQVVHKMLHAYETTKGDFAERLLCAIEAGQKEGGDKRGQQSANIIILSENRGYGGGSDVYVDVRVDDHPQATAELRRVFELSSLTLLQREDPQDITELTDELYHKIGNKLYELKYIEQTEDLDLIKAAFIQWIHTENFENKERTDGYVWNSVLNYLLSS